ncbi:DUF4265 domain-containing protein [Phycicoccus sp.]|uniref:DUF4265 domain-containing protein n=1 Tax=Phycicoccus sp. TaxID=1902410 RepID=UPI002B51556E|nr:DUF4265 domain-containing protein [Phycicoccus sp.]HMM94847.1 DUF4265 domain-containing protein [Phycicoccus sp.]
MADDSKIVTHGDPIGRAQTNYIHRIAVNDPPDGQFEQVWTRTDDGEVFELCCIPFFAYGVSFGDRIRIADDGVFQLVRKGDHRTIRVAIYDAEYAHKRHAEFHALITSTGVRWETLGHASSYWALDIEGSEQAHELIRVLTPLSEARILDWEWGDPAGG